MSDSVAREPTWISSIDAIRIGIGRFVGETNAPYGIVY